MYDHKRSPPKFQRTGSQICPSPEEELLEAVLKNNSPKIKQILYKNELLKTYTYPDYEKRILLIACSEDGVHAETVNTLLDFKADPRDFNEEDGFEALHFAAAKTDYNILDVLIRRNPGDINNLAKGSNALHVLIRWGKPDSDDFEKCAELLISKGINVNCGDQKNYTPIIWAIKKKQKNIIKLIIKTSPVPVNLDSHRLAGKTARELIEEQNLYDGVLPPPLDNNNLDDRATLFNYLKVGDQDNFINFNEGNIENLVNTVSYQDDTYTLLQFCCKRGLSQAAQHLLRNNADPNLITAKCGEKPIEIAAQNGFSDIFSALLEKYDSMSKLPEQLLVSVVRSIEDDYHDYYGCYKILINKLKTQALYQPDEVTLILNEKDNLTNSALHYAIRYGNPDVIQELLDLGASLGVKNRFGAMPIQDIEPETLEKHLDNCVTFDLKSKKLEKEDFQVTFNYRSLIPPYAKQSCQRLSNGKSHVNDNPEEGQLNSTIEKYLVSETEVIFFMSKASEFKHLLKHPVIASFLLMKWLRVQWLFWTNLAFYITFTISLGIYIFTDYAYFATEEKSTIHIVFINLSYFVLILSLIFLILRELFQICVSPRKYLYNFENWVEMALIVDTLLIVFIGSPTAEVRKQLSSIAILLASFEVVLMLGQHPYFSTNVVMLRTVSFNFFKFLSWYALLIVAFALSFYLLFTTDTPAAGSSDVMEKNQTSEDEDKSFNNPGGSIFKTVIMLTGEFDASNINFDVFPVTSKLIFALFIFMIAIILLNLLNGLAVSDTQIIKNDAELFGYVNRAQHIHYVESMLLGNIFPNNFVRWVSNICCCLPIPLNKNTIIHTLAQDACLFPKYFNYELIFYPNKNGQVCLNGYGQKSKVKKSCVPCSTIFLDKDTAKRTNSIVRAKCEKVNNNDEYIRRIEEELELLKKKMDSILNILVTSDT